MTELEKPLPEPTRAAFDPGFTQKYTGTLSRLITKDGDANVRRIGGTRWHDANPYTFLIRTSWLTFWLIVIVAFVLVNLAFAGLYMSIGVDHIKGAATKSASLDFLNLYFFSTHTLTTVGYGNMYPDGAIANVVASVEALLGLMTFAIATGLLFGRFSRPSVRFGFSSTIVIAPYQGGTSLQFRIVNRRENSLVEVEARVILMTVEFVDGKHERKYTLLDLERNQVMFLALTWTVVHPITEKSPLYGKTPDELENLHAEIFVLMKGFDESFGQIVYSRHSYRYDEITWAAKFAPAFDTDAQGDLVLWIDKISLTEPAPLP